MHKNFRVVIIGAVFVTASFLVAYWAQQYMQRSRASATAPTSSFLIAGPKVNPGESFDLILQINPNLTPFYSFDVAFTYDAAKVTLKNTDPATVLSNITPLSTVAGGAVDVRLLTGNGSTAIDQNIHKVRITAISTKQANGENQPFSGSNDLTMVKVSFTMIQGQTLPLNFIWVDPDPTVNSDSDTFEKQNLRYMGPVETPTASPTDANTTPSPTPKVCGSQICTASAACYQPPKPTCAVAGCNPALPPMICVTVNPSLRPTSAVPTPIGGYAAPDGTTTTITERKDLLYINSIGTYQSPFRYEQPIKLEKGTYTLAIGAKLYEKRGRGLIIVLVCNENTCGKTARNQVIYSSPGFPLKPAFSEMKQTLTITDDVSNKATILRIFCEDGSECELDYVSIEDAWGSERVANSQFESGTQINDSRRQPNDWAVDATANMYGTVDPAGGVNGALLINNPAK